MVLGADSLLEWLLLAERELLLFAGIFFLVGALDEFAVDLTWIWLKLTGRARTNQLRRRDVAGSPLAGMAAMLIPAWQESAVIGATIAHALKVWPQSELRIYAGCYRNDAATLRAIVQAAGTDGRVRIVILDRQGPSTKADCLNRLFFALQEDERRSGARARMILLHDAEDMVDAAALPLLDAMMERSDFVQLPVLPQPMPESRWIAGHYCEEFAEAHGKAMVVRHALGAAMPAAGVGCAFSRDIIDRLAQLDNAPAGARHPFSVESLTEDYELGLRVKDIGGRYDFIRARGEDGQLIATRAYFPDRLDHAVKQKTRWVHGIALQSWDRIGWNGKAIETWMRIRDRRGPLTALVLAAAYLLLILAAISWLANAMGYGRPWTADPLITWLLAANFASFLWRAGWRFGFTAREYGWVEGLRAVLRIPLANVIAIMAGRRAMAAYLLTLRGGAPQWEKTAHHAHPSTRQHAPLGPASAHTA